MKRNLYLFRKEEFPVLKEAIKFCKQFGFRTQRFSLDKREAASMIVDINRGFTLFAYEEIQDTSNFINISIKEIKDFKEKFLKELLLQSAIFSLSPKELIFAIEFMREDGYHYNNYRPDGNFLGTFRYQKSCFSLSNDDIANCNNDNRYPFSLLIKEFPEQIKSKFLEKIK